MLATALAVLLAAAPTAGTAARPGGAAGALLDACRRSATSAGTVFACDGGLAASVGEYPDLAPDEALRIHAGSLKTFGEVSTEPVEFSSGGKRWAAIRFAIAGRDGTTAFEGRAAARELRAGTVRLVTCGGGDEGARAGCDAVLAALAEAGPAPFAQPRTAPTFLGRKVKVPKGCEVADASEKRFRIRCGEVASVAFFALESPEHVEKISATVVEQLRQSVPDSTDEALACRIGGVKGSCRVVRAGSDASASAIVIGGAVVRGAPVAVQCVQLAIVKGVHPVCAGLITF
jgi:hypothetical protein